MARTRIGRSALALTLALVAVLAAIGALAWFVVRGRSARGVERAGDRRVAVPADLHAEVATESTPLEARTAEKGEAGAGSSTCDSEAGSGTLRIVVLDQKTHVPIPDLGFVVYRERGGDMDLAHGRTDAQGRAEVRDLEANTILVRTERRPPYAEAFGGAWLISGATREIEILAGAGSTITGRVVDERKQPLEGAALRLVDRPNDPEVSPLLAMTAPDGRFRMEHVTSRPRGVWIIRGEMRPEGWDRVRFWATLDNVWTEAGAMPAPERVVDVGDISLARAAIYAGRVIDPRGRPVTSALVSLRLARKYIRMYPAEVPGSKLLNRGPGDEGFELMPGECLTNDSGEFELRGTSGDPRVLVWTRTGVVQDFDPPDGKPGERTEGIVLQLDPSTRIELDLVDARGPITKASLKMSQPGAVHAEWRSGFTAEYPGIDVSARLSDGKCERTATTVRDADGIWRLQLRCDPADIEELEFAVGGYEPIPESTPGGVTELVRRRFSLTKLPEIQVRVVPTDPQAQRAPTPGFPISFQTCRGEPALHATAVGCCGYGSYWSGLWRGEPLELALPVRRNATYWVYAESSNGTGDGKSSPLGSFGPFEPGTGVHVIALDLSACVAETKASEKTQPPDALGPGAVKPPIPRACLRARVVDARTKEGLRAAHLEFSKVVGKGLAGNEFSRGADRDGKIDDDFVPIGDWTLRVTKRGYKSLDLGPLRALEGQTIELGTLALEPLTVRRARVVGADGGPLPARPWVKRLSSDGSDQSSEDVKEDGSFELFGDWNARILLEAGIYDEDRSRGYPTQRYLLDPWPEEEVKEIRLGPLRTVIVTVTGLDTEDPDLWPCACPAPGEPTATCDHRAPIESGHQPLERAFNPDGLRREHRYLMCFAPGRYQIYGSNLLHQLPWTELDVSAGEGDIELTLGAR